MKISVFLPSRGRPNQLVAVLHSLYSRESKKHEVTYGVACDSDDVGTIGTCEILKARIPLCHHVADRAPSLGERVNVLAEHMPADVYCMVADDMLCMTDGWDDKIAEAYAKNDHGVWWWKFHFPQPALYAIVSEKWRQAAGQIFTSYFPYWYDDIWLLELWVLATEQPMLMVDAAIGDYPKGTVRMRDVRFWHDFWHYTRPMRVKQAKEIAAKLGLRVPVSAEILATIIGKPVQSFVDSMPMIEANQGDQGPPDLNYIKAKSRAQEIMGQPQDIVKIREEVMTRIQPLIDDYEKAMRAA